MTTPVYYILNKPLPTGSVPIDPEATQPGSLWIAVHNQRLQKDGQEGCCIDWQEGVFDELDPDEYELLRGIKWDRDRIQIYSDREWLEEGRRLKIGDEVSVVNVSGLEHVTGRLRFKGRVDEGSPGTLFGIQLDGRYAGRGTADGTFRKRRYFSCDENCAVFYSLKHVRRRPPADESYRSALDLRTSDYPLILNARVVYPNDDGPQYGYIRWLGDLDQGGTRYAGVEFDHPIGKGTGRYKGRQLFTCPKNHASLVPLIGLMLAEDYERHLSESANDVTALLRPYPERRSGAQGEVKVGAESEVKVGDRVGVWVRSSTRYGVIRWIGSTRSGLEVAGIEMDDVDPACYTTGSFEGQVKFECQGRRAFFVGLNKCQPVRADVHLDPGVTD